MTTFAANHPRLSAAAGPLRDYLEDPSILEIRVTSANRVFVVRFGQGKAEVPGLPADTLETFLSCAAHLVGDAWTKSKPLLHAADPRLGVRIQAGGPPVSPGPWMVCRKHPTQFFPLSDFRAKGILTTVGQQHTGRHLEAHGDVADTLLYALREHYTVVLSGVMGSAKTSVVTALINELRDTQDRVVILEDDPEIRCACADLEFVHTSDDPVVTMRDLGKILLRMSARRVIVGEVRDGAAHDMLKAFQVGVSGLCTVHAPSAVETLPRLEQLILEVSYDRQQHLIGEAIDLICHMTPYGDSWRVTELVAVDGWDGHQYNTRRLA